MHPRVERPNGKGRFSFGRGKATTVLVDDLTRSLLPTLPHTHVPAFFFYLFQSNQSLIWLLSSPLPIFFVFGGSDDKTEAIPAMPKPLPSLTALTRSKELNYYCSAQLCQTHGYANDLFRYTPISESWCFFVLHTVSGGCSQICITVSRSKVYIAISWDHLLMEESLSRGI